MGNNKNLLIKVNLSGLKVVAYRSRQKEGLGCDALEDEMPSLLCP